MPENTNAVNFDHVNWNVTLGHGCAGVYAKVQGRKCMIVCVDLEAPELPISEGQRKAANQAGRKPEQIVPYIVKGNAQLETGHMMNLAVKPLRNKGAKGALFNY